jgi:phosphonate transport system substrate-binding protein
MKKKFIALALPLLVLVACNTTGGDTSIKDPDTLIVQFVPSVSIDSALLTKVRNLEGLLEDSLAEKGFEKNVNISIGTSMASVVEAMASGQVHAGFLTSQQYAFATLEFPDKFDVLLSSVRNAYNAQVDVAGDVITDPAVILANMNAPEYNASTTAAVKVSSYYSALYVRNPQVAEIAAAGGWQNWIKGKTVATQGVTSGSGYVYPAVLLDEAGLKFVDTANNVTPVAGNNEVGFKVVSGHQNSVLALLNEEVDGVFTFMDARSHATAFNAWKEANVGKTPFTETKAAALTPAIYNDTITTIASLTPELREALGQAFIDVVATPEGGEALAIYNHTGYLFADDADYDGERLVYQFLNS